MVLSTARTSTDRTSRRWSSADGETPIAPPPAALTPTLPPPLPVRSAPAQQPNAPTKSRRGLLIAAVAAAGLLLLIGTTVLAITLGSRGDRNKKSESLAQSGATGSDADKKSTDPKAEEDGDSYRETDQEQ